MIDGNVTYDHDGSETTSDSIALQLADGLEDGVTAQNFNLAINVNPVNDPFVLTSSPLTVDEGSTSNAISTSILDASDVDDAPGELTYTVVSVPGVGTLRLAGVALSAGQTFTQQDVIDGNVTYDHDGSETTSDSIALQLADGLEDGVIAQNFNLAINVNPVNDPFVLTSSPLTVDEGSSTNLIDPSVLNAGDPDDTANQLTYTVVSVPGAGTLRLSGVALSAGQSFTQQDVIDGNVTYDHDGSETTSDSIALQLADGLEDGVTAQDFNLSINVNPVNDQFVATVSQMSVTEGSSNNLITDSSLGVSDADDVPGELVYTLAFEPSFGTLRLSGVELTAGQTFTQQDIIDGNLTYDHDGSEASGDTVALQLADGLEDGVMPLELELAIDINPVNDEQSLQLNNPLTVLEGTGAIIDNSLLLTGDVDNPSADLVYTLTGDPTHGRLELTTNPGVTISQFTQDDIDNNRLMYIHDGSEAGSDSFEFSVDDGIGSASTGTFSINIDPLNDGFIFSNSPLAVDEGSIANTIDASILDATDPDDLPSQLIYTIVTEPGSGTLRLSGAALTTGQTFTQQDIVDGSVTYDHDGSETTSDSIALQLADSLEDGVVAQDLNLIINVNSINDAFDFTHNPLTVDEGSSGNLINTAILNASDVDDTPSELTYTVVSAPGVGTLRLAGVALSAGQTFTQQDVIDGNVTYDHDGSETTSDSIALQLADGLEDGVVAQEFELLIDVNRVNLGPTSIDDDLGMLPADAPTTIALSDLLINDSDPDGDALALVSFSQPANGTLVQELDGNLTYTPNPGFSGPDSFTYTITDGTSQQDTATVSWVVNDVPIALADQFTTLTDESLTGTITTTGSDLYGNEPVFELVNDVSDGMLNLNADGSFVYAPSPGYFGAVTFSYRLNDGIDVSDVAMVNIQVNASPVAVDDSLSVDAGDTIAFSVFANDFDPDGLLGDATLQIVSGPLHGTLIAGTNGSFSYEHSLANFVNSDEFQYQITDADGVQSGVASVRIVIQQPPYEITLDNDVVSEMAAVGDVVGDVDALDPNADNLRFRLLDDDSDPGNDLFEIDSATGAVTVKNPTLLDFEAATSHDLTVEVTDATGLSATRTFSIRVQDVNESPVLTELTRTLNEGGAIGGRLQDQVQDPEGGSMRFELLSVTDHGQITIAPDGRWEYVHDDTENLQDRFDYVATDDGGNQVVSSVNLNITPVDDLPVANADAYQTDSITPISIQPMENDGFIKPGISSIEILTQPTQGRLIANADGSLTYVPDLNADGVDSFEYRARFRIKSARRHSFQSTWITSRWGGPW